MSINRNAFEFQSTIAPLIKKFIQEKRACGYKYTRSVSFLGVAE